MSSTGVSTEHEAKPAPIDAVFVSHSSKDWAIVKDLCARLNEAGISCWLAPEKMEAGWWPRQLVNQIRSCSAVLLVGSHNANQSIQVRREVFLAADRSKTIVPVEIEEVKWQEDFAYLLAGLQVIRFAPETPDKFQKLVEALDRARPAYLSGQMAAERAEQLWGSRFLKLSLAFAICLIAVISFWLQNFTEVGWISYLLPLGAIFSPLLVYHLLPDFWRPWVRAMVRTAWIKPPRWLQAGVTVVNLVLVWFLLQTTGLGTVDVESRDPNPKTVTINGAEARVEPGTPHRFDYLRAGSTVTVVVEGLPDRRVTPSGWRTKTLEVPYSFQDSPTVLVVQDQLLARAADRDFRAYIQVIRAQSKVPDLEVRLAKGNPLQAEQPFWIGCSGKQQVIDPRVQASLVTSSWSKQALFECNGGPQLQPEDRILVTVKDPDGVVLTQSEAKIDKQGQGNQYVLVLSTT